MSARVQKANLSELKLELGPRLVRPDQVQARPGLCTGFTALDQFTLWKGLPKGEVSLFYGQPGLGATAVWIQSARHLLQQGRWAAWLNDSDTALCPWGLQQQQTDLSKLLVIPAARTSKELLWVLQELMSLSLFDLIGCNLGALSLRESQILKLKKLARTYQTALVLLHQRATLPVRSSFYALILHFQKDHIAIERALHRPTPRRLQRRDIYADLMPQFTKSRKALCG